MSIGERITDLRKKQNISQVQLAQALDISRQAVSKWENDISSPDTLNLIKLADILDTQVEYLATGRMPAPLPSPEPIIVKQIETVEKIIEVEKIVEVEKKTFVDRPVIVERPVPVERIVNRKVYRTRYIRNPLEFLLVGAGGLIIGIIIGYLL